jgi:hypothetical protein
MFGGVMNRLLLIATLAACGGSDDPRAEITTCAAGWDAIESGLPLSGKCSAACVSPTLAVAGTVCKVTILIDRGGTGMPKNEQVQCDDEASGHVVLHDGEPVCCATLGRMVGNGAEFDVVFSECE